MGVVPLSLQTLQSHAHRVGGLAGCRMLELGNQQMYCHPAIPEGSAAKEWFKAHGVIQHVSIDLNGLLGALPMDLSQPIEKPEFNNAFDIVTDFGTSEHVGKNLIDLYHCRANCHRWCRPLGIMIFMNPKTGHWPGHGYHCFTLQHYHALAKACRYVALEVSEAPSCGNYINGWQIHAALWKQEDAPFISFTHYKEICAQTVFPT